LISESCFQATKEKCTLLDKAIEERENLILEQTKLYEALMEKLQAQPEPPSGTKQSDFVTSYHEELKEKKRMSDQMKRDVKKKLKSYTNRHFPAPTSVDESSDRMFSLSDVIDDLIELSVKKPEDPYMTVSAHHWAPFIELLLSYGLVSRHPTNLNKIKLCDLHL